MKTVFIINPEAGQGKGIDKLEESIAKLGYDIEIYHTKAVRDGERFVRQYIKEHGPVRFIACGGDGSLNEVVNGCIGCAGAQVGVMPYGTGNDFCRNFPEASQEDFLSPALQLEGKTVKCDAIRYSTEVNGEKKEGYCVNMFNIGFDCNVADMTARMKARPFISGSLAYFVSIFATLIKKKGANLKIEADGKEKHTGPLLLTSVANGKYCGGGIKSNPLASVSDGMMNVNIIYNISRLSFIHKLPYYMKGTHIKLKGIENIIYNTGCKKMSITPLGGNIRICVDGEIIDAGKTEFEIVPEAFEFVLPLK